MASLQALYFYDGHGLIGSYCFLGDLKGQSGKPGDRIEGKAWIQGALGNGSAMQGCVQSGVLSKAQSKHERCRIGQK